jgi:3-oxoacyl-[acyl-carrier protein] reductase
LTLKEAIVIVTGGARGLGRSITDYLTESGAQVIVVDRDAGALKSLPDSIDSYELDVTHPEDTRGVVARIIERHGKINVLVNNAGVIYNEPMVNVMNPESIMHDYARFRESITVNLDSVFIMTSAVIEQMVKTRLKGCIINISSISARGNEGQTAYSAAKSGVNAMTVTWSKELARFGIRCNAVAPGFIDTESTRQALNDSVIKHILSNTPLSRLGEAREVAQAVGALIENNFINGVILDVNGGLSI